MAGHGTPSTALQPNTADPRSLGIAAASSGLARVALDESTPVGNGVLTVNTQEQALARCGIEGSSEDAGYAAAEAAIRTVRALAG